MIKSSFRVVSLFALAILLSLSLNNKALSEEKIILNIPIKMHDIMDEMDFIWVLCGILSDERRELTGDPISIGGAQSEFLPIIGPEMDIVVRLEARPKEGKSFTNAERYRCELVVGSYEYRSGPRKSRDYRRPEMKDAVGNPESDWYAAKPGTPYVQRIEGDLSSPIKQMLQPATGLTQN